MFIGMLVLVVRGAHVDLPSARWIMTPSASEDGAPSRKPWWYCLLYGDNRNPSAGEGQDPWRSKSRAVCSLKR